MRILKKLTLLILTSNLLLLNSSLYAQITTDGSLGAKNNLTGPNFQIPANLGQQFGGNLFHSFEKFNIDTDQSATFTGPNTVQNILSRVTGGQRSWIDGPLRSEIPNANLYLLNPSGILFGKNARLDINSGSFYASTADGVNLEGGGKFLARSPNDSVLTVARPSAFGFFDSQPASIEIQGDTLAIKNHTYYAPNGTINVTATNIHLDDSTLYAPNGTININANRGDLQISQSSVIEMKDGKPVMDENGDPLPRSIGMVDVSGERGGGQIFIRAGHFVLDRALIYADNYGDGQGFSINIGIDGEMFLKNAAKITTDNYANGYGSNLKIVARTLLQLSGQNGEWKRKADKTERECRDCFSKIAANNFGSLGIGGNIQINTSTLEITPGLIQSATQTNGPAGNTTIVADKVILKGQKYEATDKVILYKTQGTIAANTNNPGNGLGGTINITAKDMISLDDSNITAQTDGIGKAGDISIKTEKLNLANKGIISSLSNLDGSNAGNAGSIDIEAGIVNISTDRNVPISETAWNDVSGIAVMAKKARGGNINMAVRDSLSLAHSKITARSTGQSLQDNGGNIWIKGLLFSKLRELKLVDKGYILASADAGNGGDIEIWAENAFLSDNSSISAKAIQATGGNITLNMRDGLYLNNSKITAESRGNKESDNGGNLTISNLKVLDLEKSALFTSAKRGYGGDIIVPENTISFGNIKILERGAFDSPELDFDALDKARDEVVKDLIERQRYSVIDSTSLVKGKDGIQRLPLLRWKFVGLQALPPWSPALPPPHGRCSFSKENQSRFIITARDILPRCPEDLRTQTIRLWSPK